MARAMSYIFGILLLLLAIAGIVAGVVCFFKGMRLLPFKKQTIDPNGDVTTVRISIEEVFEGTGPLEALILYLPVLIPSVVLLITGLLMRITNNRTMMLLFVIVGIIGFSLEMLVMQQKEQPIVFIMAIAIMDAIGMSLCTTEVVLAMKLVTLVLTAVAVMLLFSALVYCRGRDSKRLLLFLLLAAGVFLTLALPRAFRDMGNPARTSKDVKEAVDQIETFAEELPANAAEFANGIKEDISGKASGNTNLSDEVEEGENETEFDGIVDSPEELVAQTDFLEKAEEAGISSWTYVSAGEDGEQYVWSNEVLYKYQDGTIETVASDVPEKIIVAGGNYYYLTKNLHLMRNGEDIADHVSDLRKSSDGKGVTYSYHGEDHTVY